MPKDLPKHLLLLFITFLSVGCTHTNVNITDLKDMKLEGWSKIDVGQKTLGYGIIGNEKKSVLFLATGSKCIPMFQITDDNLLKSRLHINSAKFYNTFGINVLALERKGLVSFAKIPENINKINPRLRCTNQYGGLTLKERVDDYLIKLNTLKKEPWFGDLIILGHSEGVDVALEVASKFKGKINAIGLFSGATTNQLFDQIVIQRKSTNSKGVFNVFDDMIWITSNESEGKYGGYPVDRFKSFVVENTPLNSALKTKYPLYIVSGTRDKKAAIEGADAFVLEILRAQHNRLVSYHNYSNLDHDFLDSKGNDKSEQVFSDFLKWVNLKNRKREFVIH